MNNNSITSIYFQVENICVSFDNQHNIVDGLNFSLNQGDIGCLLGSSGSGKTTALRAIAGLQAVNAGKITLNQQVLTHNQHLTAPAKRHMGMVFQDYALFTHLTVAENVGFGLHQLNKSAKQARINEMLTLVDLIDHANKRIDQLSGGQQQRVALARALAPKPALLLLDEPFSNLDIVLRENLAMRVRDIIKQTQTTAILVTHDQQEAFAMADKIGVMYAGKLQQFASPAELYHHPKTAFVADFIGEGTLITGKVENNAITTHLGKLSKTNQSLNNGSTVKILIRPDDIIYDDSSSIQAKILSKVFRGSNFLYRLQLTNGEEVLSLIPSYHHHDIGHMIGICPKLQHIVIID